MNLTGYSQTVLRVKLNRIGIQVKSGFEECHLDFDAINLESMADNIETVMLIRIKEFNQRINYCLLGILSKLNLKLIPGIGLSVADKADNLIREYREFAVVFGFRELDILLDYEKVCLDKILECLFFV